MAGYNRAFRQIELWQADFQGKKAKDEHHKAMEVFRRGQGGVRGRE